MYCERKITMAEMVAFHHIGITISGIPSSSFFLWSNINRVEAHYDCITIETARSGVLRFDLRRNLQFEELDQIHEFCRHYLKTGC
jgi:DNA-binding transcriptional regulator YdaS (Cro superfamily)